MAVKFIKWHSSTVGGQSAKFNWDWYLNFMVWRLSERVVKTFYCLVNQVPAWCLSMLSLQTSIFGDEIHGNVVYLFFSQLLQHLTESLHDKEIPWERFLYYWPFVGRIFSLGESQHRVSSVKLWCHMIVCGVLLGLGIDQFCPYSSGLLHWHWGNHMIAPVPVKQPWNKNVN